MFGKLHEKLNKLLLGQEVSETILDQVYEDVRKNTTGLYGMVQDVQVWVELIALENADRIADEFEKKLDKAAASDTKLTNKTLKEMVKQSAIDARK